MNKLDAITLRRMANALATKGEQHRQYVIVLDGVAYCLAGPWLAAFRLNETLEDSVMDRHLKVVNGGVAFPDFRRAIPAALDEGREVCMERLAPLLAAVGRRVKGVYLTIDWSSEGKGIPLLMAHAAASEATFVPTRVIEAMRVLGDDMLKTARVYFDARRGMLIAVSDDKTRFALIPAVPA